MNFRSDLAVEWDVNPSCQGISLDRRTSNDTHITRIRVTSGQAAEQLQRPMGTYLTAELPPLDDVDATHADRAKLIAELLRELLPPQGTVLVAGIGNRRITADALGPLTADMVLATRHIGQEFSAACGLEDLRSAAVTVPGVLGQTGVESSEAIAALCRWVRPAAVIVIDALAARLASRIGCTVQINDSGISPGSGVGNHRHAIDRATLGIPVVAVGVPTVIDAATLVREFSDAQDIDAVCRSMVVTPREIDILVQRAARLLAYSINLALQPDYDPRELAAIAIS